MQKVESGPESKKKVPALAQLFQPPTNCKPLIRATTGLPIGTRPCLIARLAKWALCESSGFDPRILECHPGLRKLVQFHFVIIMFVPVITKRSG